MLVRLAGRDADVVFNPKLLDVVMRIEDRFAWPEYAVMFSDAQEENAPDNLILARRYSGVLVPMVYIPVDEIDELEGRGGDWLDEVASDLDRTEEEIQEVIAAQEAEGAPGAETEAPGLEAARALGLDGGPGAPGFGGPGGPGFGGPGDAGFGGPGDPGFGGPGDPGFGGPETTGFEDAGAPGLDGVETSMFESARTLGDNGLETLEGNGPASPESSEDAGSEPGGDSKEGD